MTAPILRRLEDLRGMQKAWMRAGETVGVVPTMGALHAGHLSLVEAAKAACDRVIVTIFVNPRQFNNAEDLANYPRTELDDAEKLAPFGVDAIYVPDPDQIYPDGYATNVSVAGFTDVMEGEHRPGHFDGVATVVAKLFLQTGADQAFFGAGKLNLQSNRFLAPTLQLFLCLTVLPGKLLTLRPPAQFLISMTDRTNQQYQQTTDHRAG